ncbi:MAG: hypothetical protein ACTHMS_09565 [Jatrophihabitans sp.]|uniref:hypothetical protein n=1 Tax=Jatrophihabitans sp. TaxID=1932789 RepID=UPI003F7F1E89
MTGWIDLHALWRIVVAGLLFGAGLPALFGLGLRLVSPADDAAGPAGGTVEAVPRVAGWCCFAVVLAAVGWGIYLIVEGT